MCLSAESSVRTAQNVNGVIIHVLYGLGNRSLIMGSLHCTSNVPLQCGLFDA